MADALDRMKTRIVYLDYEFDRFGDVVLSHWHVATDTIEDGSFRRLQQEADAHGWRVVGEPIETDVPAACRFVTSTGAEVVRHFLIPVEPA